MKLTIGKMMIELNWTEFATGAALYLAPSPLRAIMKPGPKGIETGEKNMGFEIVHKEVGQFLQVESRIADGKLQASAALDISGLLDMGAAKVKAAIPGQVDDMVIDLVINKLKEELLK